MTHGGAKASGSKGGLVRIDDAMGEDGGEKICV
jgi:hypothetical protein